MTPAFPQSDLQYHSIAGSTGLSQDWFLLLEEERQCLKRQCLSQERSGMLPNHGPDARAGLRAPLGVVGKLAIKFVSELSSWVLEITPGTDRN